ncbi:MAG: extracellular solute-binding protein [Anaerolineales bacterium]|nr:extracellular solute-binding protein [Anaerolineales bacterium]
MPRWPVRLICLLALVAAACGSGPTATAPAVTVTSAAGTPAVTTPAQTAAPGTAEPTSSAPGRLRLWLPPELTPDVNTPGGRVLAAQFQAFEQAHPGSVVEIRTKAATGVGGLLNALVTAANVAPSILPDIVALRRDDLALAAEAGLVEPLEGFVPAATLADLYPFAQGLGRVNGVWVGLPFAADARVLAYATTFYPTPPTLWSDVDVGVYVLPGGEPTALTLLSGYLARGGTLADDAGAPHLDTSVLAATLQEYQGLESIGRLPLTTLDYVDAAGTWQALRQRQAALVATSAQQFLGEQGASGGVAMTLLPTAGQPSLALADGWSWALVNLGSDQHTLAAELLNDLLAPAQHAVWTEAAGVLPTRAATLAAWKNAHLAEQAGVVLARAQLQPAGAVLGVVGPALRQALAEVVSGRATPFAAATVAAEAVAGGG